MKELLNNAFTGVNIIPTILLILVVFYWLTVIIGIIDLDLDIFDFDMDLEIGDSAEGFQAILAFLNFKDIPIMVIISILSLVFWMLSMFICLIPRDLSRFEESLLLIPILLFSIVITKIVSTPLKGLFRDMQDKVDNMKEVIVGQLVTLTCDVKNNRLGQGEIKRDGASLLINVKSEFKEEIFYKDEEAYVLKKDDHKNVYYIVKTYKKI